MTMSFGECMDFFEQIHGLAVLSLRLDLRRTLRPEMPLEGSAEFFSLASLVPDGGEKLLFGHLIERIHPDDRESVLASLSLFLERCGKECMQAIHFRISQGNEIRWLSLKPGLIQCAGRQDVLVGVLDDVTEARIREESLQERFDFLSELINTLPNAVFAKTADTRFVTFNRAYEHIFGVDRNALIGKTVMDLEYLPMADRLNYQAEDERMIRDGQTAHREADFIFSDGEVHHCLYWSSGFHHRDRGLHGLVGTIVDISEQKRIERELAERKAEIEKISRTDPLTGLANRRFFMEMYQTAFSMVRRHSHGLSLIMVDIDHFKSINDSFGHEAGDRVLVQFADILRCNCRQEDLPARTGGEEFLILLPMTRLEEARSQAERIRLSLAAESASALIQSFTISAGVVEWRPGDSPEALLKRVDALLYEAKAQGRNRVCSER